MGRDAIPEVLTNATSLPIHPTPGPPYHLEINYGNIVLRDFPAGRPPPSPLAIPSRIQVLSKLSSLIPLRTELLKIIRWHLADEQIMMEHFSLEFTVIPSGVPDCLPLSPYLAPLPSLRPTFLLI